MPHIAIKMYPGRNEETKTALAKKMQDAMSEELKISKDIISVSIEDIQPDNWQEEMDKIPLNTRYLDH